MTLLLIPTGVHGVLDYLASGINHATSARRASSGRLPASSRPTRWTSRSRQQDACRPGRGVVRRDALEEALNIGHRGMTGPWKGALH